MSNKKSYYVTLALGFAGLILMGFSFPSCPFFGAPDPFDEALDNDAVFDLFEDDFGTDTAYDDRFVAEPKEIKKVHKKGKTECPQKLDDVKFSGGPDFKKWEILNPKTLPPWITANRTTGSVNDPLKLSFPCSGFKSGENKAEIKVTDGVAIDTIGVELLVE